jgi:hypothetical protein
MTNEVALGNIDLRKARKDVTFCLDCGSRNTDSKSEPDQDAIQEFVRNRAVRLGVDLNAYTISISREGAVTAKPKDDAPPVEIVFG